jgi:isoleucyl-tRNA synthetase
MARRPVDPSQSFPELEEQVLERWRERDVFAASLRNREGAEPWVFWEGPPTANGRPGSHHVLARAFKDIYPRYKTMRGHLVERKGGWDCHGLPVEITVEQQLGLKNKHDIEAYGIAEFNAKCRASVFEFLEDWNRLTERIGFWVDLEHAYRTLDSDYIESVWWALRQIYDKDLLYEGHKVVPYCPRCGTALSSHELALGYRDVVDPSVYVRFPVAEDGGPVQAGDELLVWTTTPWTLVSNAAVAVDPELTYVRAKTGALEAPVVLAEALVERVLPEGAQILARFPGAALDGVRYQPPFNFIKGAEYGERGHTVLLGDFVTAEDGTGLVHTAIAFGEDDFRLGAQYGLNVVNPVRLDGTYDERIKGYEGRFVKDADADLACWTPTSTSPGTLSTSSTGASAAGWRTTSTGRCRASATGARRCRCGAARAIPRTSIASGPSPSCGSSRASRSPIRIGPTSTTSRSRARRATGRCAACRRSSTSGSTPAPCPSRSGTRRSRTRIASSGRGRRTSSARRWTRRAGGSTRCWRSRCCCSTARPTRTSSASG